MAENKPQPHHQHQQREKDSEQQDNNNIDKSIDNNNNNDIDVYVRAATAIINADILLICVGAGMSADSGLPVYNQIANVPVYRENGLTYADICQPHWLDDDPQLFYGFWGKCYNDYKEKDPHNGHHILLKWANQMFYKSLPYNPALNSFFVYSSNVDTHMEKAGFPAESVEEIHGNCIEWHCYTHFEQHTESIQFPKNFRFDVNSETMRANLSQIPKCKLCEGPLRPRVLMFNDDSWIGNRKTAYERWKLLACELSSTWNKTKYSKLVIVEIGCGQNVPSVRYESESYFNKDRDVVLIRINPDFPDSPCPQKTIGIKAHGKESLEKIDEKIQHILQQKGLTNEQADTNANNSLSGLNGHKTSKY